MNLQALDAAVRAACPAIDGVSVGDPADRSTWSIAFQAGATLAQRQAATQALAGYVDPAPVRSARLGALLDRLTPTQRASITADHMARLQAEPAEHQDGFLPITNMKVLRAADDLGMTPDAWFTLAGA